MSLKKLLHKCIQQDIKAQEELYRLYSGKLFTLCLKYSNNYQDAEDTLQDGFLKIFENIHQFRGTGSLEGWMTRTIINTALKKYNKKTFFINIDEELLEEPDVELKDELVSVDFLLQSIQELPDSYRLVFSLYALDGYSHKEISSMLGISEGTSKSNLARARKKLKQRIENHLNNNRVQSL